MIIQITGNQGCTVEQKGALYKAIVDGLATKAWHSPEVNVRSSTNLR